MNEERGWHGGPYSKNFPERAAARMVTEGILRLDPDGSVWRLRRYWPGTGQSRPLEVPNRIDYGPPGGHRFFEITIAPMRSSKVQVARLIWQLAHGDIPPKLTVNHKDGKPDRNVLENFELLTHSEQHLHRYRVLGQESRPTIRERHLMAFVDAARAALQEGGDLEPLRAALKSYDERPIALRTKWYVAKKERERLAKIEASRAP